MYILIVINEIIVVNCIDLFYFQNFIAIQWLIFHNDSISTNSSRWVGYSETYETHDHEQTTKISTYEICSRAVCKWVQSILSFLFLTLNRRQFILLFQFRLYTIIVGTTRYVWYVFPFWDSLYIYVCWVG